MDVNEGTEADLFSCIGRKKARSLSEWPSLRARAGGGSDGMEERVVLAALLGAVSLVLCQGHLADFEFRRRTSETCSKRTVGSSRFDKNTPRKHA